MADGKENTGEPEAPDSKILNQEEIDSLLGYGESLEDASLQKNGVQAILNSNMVSYERLPMFLRKTPHVGNRFRPADTPDGNFFAQLYPGQRRSFAGFD